MAAIETWLLKNKFEISYTRFFEKDQLPEVSQIDWLIIMGGAMSANDEQEFPWLIKEKEFVRQCIRAGKVVIGICLGSQLIANAMGAKVYRNTHKEIGWFPIEKRAGVKSRLFSDMPDQFNVFHWHGETFDLPEGAELIASSTATPHQIFTIGDKVVGFQCHFETTHESLLSINEACHAELVSAKYIQNQDEMIQNEKHYATPMHQVLFKILDHLKG
jgi:GMP synthase (glutamine-hydrolysing)